jgi:hypothetical protein
MAAAKKRSLDAKVNAPTRLVEKGLAAVSHDIAHRPTNSSVAAIVHNVVGVELHEKLSPLSEELKSIRKDLEVLKEKAENTTGITKEIDHAFERITAMEKFLDGQSTGWRRRAADA